MKNLKIKSGLLALVFGLAIVFSQSAFKYATNNGGKGFDQRTFYYHGPSAYTQAQVEDESNWTIVPNDDCDAENQAACEIKIDVSFVDNPSSPTPTLSPSANLVSAYNSLTSSAYITGSDDPLMTKENRTK
jgi:hypothetical protein